MKIVNFKLKIIVMGLLFVATFVVRPVVAFDPSLPNNKYGIHLAQPEEADIKGASELVNSSGGKWGYVTLVIQDNDRNREKWQGVFEKLREAHLIPIIRIATHPEGASWKKPTVEEAKGWADFLNSLEWVVKDRYVILFNEPNHGAEWGGEANPDDYGRVALAFAKALKEKNKDFFVMLAGLDSSAPHAPPAYFDEAYFLQNINPEGEKLFDYIDGWTSHSYPNPGFAGSPYNAGRGSIRSYEWELATLEGLGVSKNLPVFITETGWTSTAFSYDTIGEFFKIAYESVWLPDARVRAVTPFILNYQGEPFLQFSWKKFLNPSDPNPVLGLEEKAYYEHYYAVQSLKKPVGEPEVLQKGSVALDLPALIVSSSSYSFHVHLKNEGQAIWSLSEGYELKFTDGGKEYLFGALPDVKPHEEVEVPLFFKTNEKEGMATSSVALYRGDKKILESAVWKYEVVAPPSLTFDVRLFPRLRPDPSRRYEIQIFDDHNQIVFKKSGLRAPAGRATIDKVPNVYLGKRFRIVILTRNYLPSQLFVSLKRGDNEVKFARLLPLDFDADGNFDIADVGTLITHPQQFGLLLP